MKKFYCFKAGQDVPSWMWRVETSDLKSKHKNKSGKIVFAVSCIAVREDGEHTKLMPSKCCGNSVYLKVRGIDNAVMGGINGASGIHLFKDKNLNMHGKGLFYKVTNSKVEQINQINNEE